MAERWEVPAYMPSREEIDAFVDRSIAVRAERDALAARLAEAEQHIGWLLPMAKGYAHAHDVGSNWRICDGADAFLRASSNEPAGLCDFCLKRPATHVVTREEGKSCDECAGNESASRESERGSLGTVKSVQPPHDLQGTQRPEQNYSANLTANPAADRAVVDTGTLGCVRCGTPMPGAAFQVWTVCPECGFKHENNFPERRPADSATCTHPESIVRYGIKQCRDCGYPAPL
jgi:hypothetical protein